MTKYLLQPVSVRGSVRGSGEVARPPGLFTGMGWEIRGGDGATGDFARLKNDLELPLLSPALCKKPRLDGADPPTTLPDMMAMGVVDCPEWLRL